jgi:hypothetical protein
LKCQISTRRDSMSREENGISLLIIIDLHCSLTDARQLHDKRKDRVRNFRVLDDRVQEVKVCEDRVREYRVQGP